MGIGAIILLAIALAMDAAAVATANVLCATKRATKRFYLMPLLFGLFQTGMVLLGLLIGVFVVQYIGQFTPYVVAVIFCLLGLQMIYEGRQSVQNETTCLSHLPFSMLLVQAFFTAIDALAAGVFLETYGGNWLHAFAIGLITAAIVWSAILLAKKLKNHIQHYGPYIGSAILFMLAFYTLVSM